jgi:glucoamylase
MSHGILNEIYFPTIDRPQTRDMELLFCDGETFCHEEKRDLDYEFEYVDGAALAVKMTGKERGGRYQVTKTVISNPHFPAVMVHVKVEGDAEILRRMKCYVLLAPHLNGGGAGNSARSVDVAGKRCLLAWKGNTSLAMGVECGFSRSSCGFVGSSDGYQDLFDDLQMSWQFGQAMDGNIAVTGEVDLASNPEFTIAIAFGDGHHAALTGMLQTLATPFEDHLKRFLLQWGRAKSPERLAAVATDGGVLARISQNVVLAHEDKSFSGAFIASASIPWGSSKGDNDLGGYHLVWTRDMVQTATALLACEREDTALRALVYLACTQRPDGSFAQNFWIDGTPYWQGIQLDEVAFPIILAWRLWKRGKLGTFRIFPFVERAASFLVKFAPVTQQERWEETAGYSPSTLAAVIAGLVCAADIARAHASLELAGFLEGYADWIEAHLDEWTTTRDGVLHPDVKYHYVRITPPAPGEPFHDATVPVGSFRIANRGPGEQNIFEAREVIDGGFLELVRYGIRRPDDPLIVDSLKVVDHILKTETPLGPCWRRYNHDGYGQKKDGGPFDWWGQGRPWPLLTGERAHYELAAGRSCQKLTTAIEKFSSKGGMLPEQIWDEPDLPTGKMKFGRAAGSAQPLVWAHSEYLKLLRSLADGEVFDKIPVVAERYAVPAGKRTFSNHRQIYSAGRPVRTVPAGHTLRIVDSGHFRVVYTTDDWQTTNEAISTMVSPSGAYVDIPTAANQTGKIIFTQVWAQDDQPDRWLGRNIEVAITSSSGGR